MVMAECERFGMFDIYEWVEKGKHGELMLGNG